MLDGGGGGGTGAECSGWEFCTGFTCGELVGTEGKEETD